LKYKRPLIALAAAGVTGVLAFGGSAVATSFSSDSGTNYVSASAASVTVIVTNGNIGATNLIPGALPTGAGSVTITNASPVPTHMTVTFQPWVTTKNGTTGAPDLSKLSLHFSGVVNATRTAAALSGSTFDLGVVGANTIVLATVTEQLDGSASNNWNGAAGYLPYVVHVTSTH
jgi:hypothetical protein